ncbi:PREDICTED: LOW QUALITY PROTEIN: cytochrome b561 domain-containing protein 1 [Myotis davidii]|uniref:LOW QUALITY PROTEIN: cytochrome b561 domain-containing protein 1 n=1 Tax=Myotis davidii TaxID=225400 RepID=UPI0007678A44|nr:PREDICTED: LOW QUALITY PROTEIN: cytochrome b561 domain-containing protein 1 [Myotis davidii]
MQSLELGLVPTPAREPRLTRWLLRGSGILAHLLALGFTIFLTVLSRPGTVFSPGTLYSWPRLSASAWPGPSSSSRLITPCSPSAPERKGPDPTALGGAEPGPPQRSPGPGLHHRQQDSQISRVARLKLYHLTCGLVVYLMATVTVVLGMYSVWFQAQIKGEAWYLCLAQPLYPALVIVRQISSSYLPRKKTEI